MAFAGAVPRAVTRLRSAWMPLVQAAAGATLAWFLVHNLIGHQTGIFAPIGAMLTVYLAPGHRLRGVLETVLGAALGVGIADLLISAIGTGALQVGLVVLLAMAIATLLGGGQSAVTQAGIAGVLIATIQPPHGIFGGLAASRFIDVVVGGGTGLVVTLAFSKSPRMVTQEAAAPFFSELPEALEQVAEALETGDAARADEALARVRGLEGSMRRLREAIELAKENARLVPFHWRAQPRVAHQTAMAPGLQLITTDAAALARAAIRAIELEPEAAASLALAVRDLAAALGSLALAFAGADALDEGRAAAWGGAAASTLVVRGGGGVPVNALVGQIRTLATDVLLALGIERGEAVDGVRGAVNACLEREAR
jgi:uncharacterized membrane protein YgaE (UPF0421/DUF939 family)